MAARSTRSTRAPRLASVIAHSIPLGGGLAHATSAARLPSLGEEPRRAGVERPLRDRANVHVPEVDQVVGQAHELQTLVEVDAEGAHPVDRDPAGDRAVVADRLAD